MADIKFSCPHCRQHITCDELWGGHQLQCPSCQGTLTVPARPAPAAAPPPAPAPAAASAPSPGGGSSHVFKAPATHAPRLSIGQQQANEHGAPAAAAPKNIPIRNLAPPKPKKANLILTILKVAVGVAVVGVAGYFGFTWLRQMQDKSNAKAKAEEARRGGESQVGHIANLNSVLDATEPGHLGEVRGERSSGATTRPTGIGSEIPMNGNDGRYGRATTPGQASGPVVPPAYTLDLGQVKIPPGRVNGTISGTNFVADVTRVLPSATAQVLQLMQGPPSAPDRQILVYLHLKPGEKIGGQSLTVAPDAHGPTVAKIWKPNPRTAPSNKQYSTGYAMKLELGMATNDAVAGKIYLALPDPEQTVVAGEFSASLTPVDTTMQASPMATPVARPLSSAEKAMYDRYGVKR